MKRAVIFHGTDGNPDINWFPWLKEKLETEGCEVWVPLLPENHTPNRNIYNDFLFNFGWDFTDNIIIGHSSGAVEVLNLLMDDRCPHIKLGVIVGAWAGGVPNGYDKDTTQFNALFPDKGFDFKKITHNADRLEFIHGDNDPYCPISQAKWLAEQTDGNFYTIPNGGHLGSEFKELPVVWDVITKSVTYK